MNKHRYKDDEELVNRADNVLYLEKVNLVKILRWVIIGIEQTWYGFCYWKFLSYLLRYKSF